MAGQSGFYYKTELFWYRATGSDPGSWTWTPDGFFDGTHTTQVVITARRDCKASGDPIDAFAVNWKSGATLNSGSLGEATLANFNGRAADTTTFPSITTTLANTQWLAIDTDFADTETNQNPPTGFTDRVDIV